MRRPLAPLGAPLSSLLARWSIAALAASTVGGACSSPPPRRTALIQTVGDASGTGGGGGVNFGDGSTADPRHPVDADCATATPDQDADHDGWSIIQGDCNDCDWRVNPGAIDVATSTLDNDCDATPDEPATPCDGAAAFDDAEASQAARAIELCKFLKPGERGWGVLASRYVRVDGSAAMQPGLQAGLQSGFGPNVKPRQGKQLLVLSSGNARLPGQPGACGGESCGHSKNDVAPKGFPQDYGCGGATNINDAVAFEVHLRSPTNATGYSFDSFFYTFEYPEWVCSAYNDQFVALVSPAPAGAHSGNIAFDAKVRPVSVNIAFFDVCDPKEQPMSGPPFKCSRGPSMMVGTGFGDPPGGWNSAGGTGWLTTKAPVFGGDELTIRFAVWDTGDQLFDSSVLVDHFQWIADAASPAITTDHAK